MQITRRRFNALVAGLPIAAMAANVSPAFSQYSDPPVQPRAKGKWQASWENISAHEVPTWFTDARLGLSMHWGLYSVPAHQSEWYFKHMYGDAAISKWHAEHFGPQDKFGYKDFIPMFTLAKWDPEEWAQLFKDSGIKYVSPTVEHHDGFSMWDSKVNKWNMKNFGPKRDIFGELVAAVRKQGLKVGACDHSMEHYNFVNPLPDLATDLNDPVWKEYYSVADRTPERRARFERTWHEKQIELIDKYQLDTLWWDNGANGRNYDPMKLDIMAHFYNRGDEWGKPVSMLTKGNCSLGGHVQDYERQGRGSTKIEQRTFEVHDSPGSRWCYLTDDRLWPSYDIIWRIVENTSKNGNLLFNIGPKPDGTIGDDYRRLLTDAGKWLKVNGEAIYGSRPWKKYGEGTSLNNNPRYTAEDVRFTTKGDTLYAMFMQWPGTEGVIKSLAKGSADTPAGTISKVEMLGSAAPLEFGQDETGLKVKMPAAKPCDFVYTVKITGLKLS
jgi:alpha-L-fucosidase